MVAGHRGTGEWVLLNYQLPREPSTPRSAVWRKLRQLGVLQLSDGLVALPADARTREQLEWVAEQVREAAGTAALWLAHPVSIDQERLLATSMATARATEYRAVTAEATAGRVLGEAERIRLVRRLRNDLHRIRRRDFFPPFERDAAIAAIDMLVVGPPPTSERAPTSDDAAATRS